ncbi:MULTISPECIES: protein tyrosine phosphatase [unclassified Variovorax]|uniref:arsenate reductase/protein-tyrosine-phosphatase family protein n=1 Tax=unclassified Variovorax TaxID=663243 RepID=UPI002575768A|nr:MULTISPECIES: protein tyrosine phosphatase [unclassified Variovorax]MDM0087895.1 protein tyrosine phosphatase [Variovorax sp. J22G40]MDM0143849.1 protein tyrosine phosphatase [Variovorax sp. J2P1-31]
MSERLRIVFISRRNSLRSVLAEACLSHLNPTKFVVSSGGQPGQVAAQFHPAAIGALNSAGIALPAGRPKAWDAVLRRGAPVADFVITLDAELPQSAPRWPGQPEVATWPFPDIAVGMDAEETAVAAIRMLYALRRRLELLSSLPLRGADRSAVRGDVRDLAHWH